MADYAKKKTDLEAKIVLWKETIAKVQGKIKTAEAIIVKCAEELAKPKKS